MQGLIIDAPQYDVFEQMAFDELCARQNPPEFVLRFFDWKHGPSVTFGYAQPYAEVKRQLPPGRYDGAAARRPTGGGIVFHDDDLTFSCVFPCPASLSPGAIYRKLHSAVNAGLAARGIGTRLCGPSERDAYLPSKGGAASACFSNPVSYDVLDDSGRKLLGGAIRRFGGTILYQGSLQLEGARLRAPELSLVILRGLAAEWNIRWSHYKPDGKALAAVLAEADKYRSAEWLDRF